MEKVQSLAEHLGTADPTKPEASKPQPKGKMSAREFSLGILNSEEYRVSVLQRIYLGTLPPAIESLLYHYAHGKPVERVEVKDTTDDVDEMSIEQCENEAMRLLEIARHLRTDEEPDASIH